VNPRPPQAIVGTPQAASRGGRGRLLLLVLAAVAVAAALRFLPVNQWLLGFVAWIRGAGTAGMAIFLVAYVVACVLLLPGLVLTLGAGFAYGVAVGVPLVWVSANLGAAVAFLLGRTLAASASQRALPAIRGSPPSTEPSGARDSRSCCSRACRPPFRSTSSTTPTGSRG